MKKIILFCLAALLGYSLVAFGYVLIMFANTSGYPFIIVGDIVCIVSIVRFFFLIRHRDKDLIENRLIKKLFQLKENNRFLSKLSISGILIILFSLAFGLDLIMNIYYFVFS